MLPALVAGAAKTNLFTKKLPKNKTIIHALNRLTFGPRPGDVEAVRKMGLKKWIDLQLHPARIPENPELLAKLKPLDTLQMSTRDMLAQYPPPQVLQAIARGDRAGILPQDPALRARAERLAKLLDERRNGQRPAQTLDQLLDPEGIGILRTGAPDEKIRLLNDLPEEKLAAVIAALPPNLRRPLLAASSTGLQRKLLASTTPQQVIVYDLTEAKLLRAVYSSRQLEESLVDFWYNHFNVFLDKGSDRYLVTAYERDAIRPHVLGTFRDLLEATARSPAMLFYLDNAQSVAPGSEPPAARRFGGFRPFPGRLPRRYPEAPRADSMARMPSGAAIRARNLRWRRPHSLRNDTAVTAEPPVASMGSST